MASDDSCPVCRYERHSIIGHDDHRTWVNVDCPRCGFFSMDLIAPQRLPVEDKPRMKLSAWIRQHQEFARPSPTILQENIDGIVESLPAYRIADKQRMLLEAIERRTDNPADGAQLLLEQDFPVAWAADERELRYLVSALVERGLLKASMGGEQVGCEITPDGWDYIDARRTEASTSRKVFVAMWFDNSMDDAWHQGVRAALENVGYEPRRVDKVHHVERIDAKIQADIKESRFMVADVTGQRQGVYFEAGYAIGLGLPVVWCVRKDELDKVHFDTRQFNHVVWKDAEDLCEQLVARVVAVIGRAE